MSHASVSTKPGPALRDAVPVPSCRSVAVWIPGAHVRIQPDLSNEQVRFEATVPKANADTSRRVLASLGLSIERNDGVSIAPATPAARDSEAWRRLRAFRGTVQVDVFVPTDVALTLRASGGSVHCREFGGSVSLYCAGTTAHLESLRGTLDVRAYGGATTIERFTGRTVSVQAAAGALALRRVEARTVEVRAASTPVTLDDVDGAVSLGGHGTVTTMASIRRALGASIHGGSLVLRASPDVRARLRSVGATVETAEATTT